jgi:hypothetical protein
MHEQQTCPRCGQGFTCKPGNISACQCQGITLSAASREWIAQRYAGCLCKACLAALQNPALLFQEKFRKEP